ncbi:MAG: hypothetical protein ABIY50_07290 [Ignavibacteria bacterium]
MSVKYQGLDYIVEVILIGLAGVFVYLIFKKDFTKFNKDKIFRAILTAGIALRIIFAVHDFIDRPLQDSDYEKHERLGQRLVTEGRFYDFAGVELRNFRQPGLPAMFAVGLLIYNHPVTYAVIMILFSFGVLIAGFFLFRDLKNVAALLAFSYLSISPNMLFMASNSNTQLSFFFFLILLFIVLKNYTGKFYQLVIIGAILASEMYIRFNFLMVFILIPFILEKNTAKNSSLAFRNLGIIYLSCLIFYFPWIYRNYNIYGSLRFMPTSGLGLYSSNVTKDPKRVGDYNGVPDSVMKKYSKLSEVEFDKALQKETFDFVKANPDVYVKGLPYKIVKYSGRQDWTISYFFQFTDYPNKELLEGFFQSIENFFIWTILLFPVIFLFRNKNLTPLSVYILWAYLSYTLVLIPISETRSRYNFPYILFPVFAVALLERRNERSSSSINLEK